MLKRTGQDVDMKAGRDLWWHDVIEGQSPVCEPVWVNAEHPLFLLYTSGSTGKPKGIQHSSAGYLLGAKLTSKWVFDLNDDDVFWCTADIGWVTGHSYVAYGPLAAGATVVIYEGAPDHAAPGTLLADLRAAGRHDFLHRADRDPRAHETRRRHSGALRPHEAAVVGLGGRAHQSRKPGCGTTSTSAACAAPSSTPGGRPKPAPS